MIVQQNAGPLLGVHGGDCHVLPVTFSQELCSTTEDIRKNIEYALTLNLGSFEQYLASPHNGVISLVGSGPSLEKHYQEVEGDVMAFNAAHDFLIARGIVPKFGMMFDADPVIEKFITPHPDVTYLLASRCHKAVFDKFKGYKVVVWHAMGDLEIQDLLEKHQVMEPIINGGSAAVVRGMGLAAAMGYRTQRLFGVDGSLSEGKTHIIDSVVPEKQMDIYCDHLWFRTTSWMANQAEDFKLLGLAFKEAGIRIVIHGTGLIPHIARVLGFEVIGDALTT